MRVTLGGRSYKLRAGESVLDGLNRHGLRVPSSCRAGVCQSCIMRATSGEPGAAAQDPVKDTLRAQGYFLACASRPASNLTVALADDEDVSVAARLGPVAEAGPGVLRVWLQPCEPLSFRAGQYVTLRRRDGLSRSYSVANLPLPRLRRGMQPVELHVRLRQSGAMSGWLATAPPGTPVRLLGPAGHCFYLPGQPERPLLLAGTGTGIAPLAAVARDAITSGHTGPITIVHGAASPDGLYLHDELRELAASRPSIQYRPCVMSGSMPGAYTGDIVDAAVAAAEEALAGADVPLAGVAAGPVPAGGRFAATRPRFAGGGRGLTAGAVKPRGFLCGGSGSVRRMRKALFLAGVPLSDILADEFLPGAGP